MLVKYREREYLGDFKCIDHVKSVYLYKAWWSGGLLYGYTDRFNVISISKWDIMEVKE